MDLHKIARVTRLSKLGKGRLLLVAAAVAWSALSLNMSGSQVAEAARFIAASGTALTATAAMDAARIGGIPYRGRNGQVVVSGSRADLDCRLTGYSHEAQRSYDMARASEPAITMDMLTVVDSIGASMEGLEYSVKTAGSVSSKLQRKTDKAIQAGRLPKTDAEYVQEMGDLVRYTMLVPHNSMAAKTKEAVLQLVQKGYTLEELDNKYLDKDGRYKALHLEFTSPGGQSFEVQVHSPESLQAGKDTHAMYEEWRRPETSPDRKAELYQTIKAVYDALPEPEGIMTLGNYTRQAEAA